MNIDLQRVIVGAYRNLDEAPVAVSPRHGLMCPSASKENATYILGFIDENDVELLEAPIAFPQVLKHVLDESDLQSLKLIGLCIESMCVHWNNGCRLGKAVAISTKSTYSETCKYRSKCRWFIENGDAVCGHCMQMTNILSDDNEGRTQTYDAYQGFENAVVL